MGGGGGLPTYIKTIDVHKLRTMANIWIIRSFPQTNSFAHNLSILRVDQPRQSRVYYCTCKYIVFCA